jgi:hypothetical protein
MNGRLDLKQIAAKVQTDNPGVYVGTVYDVDYAQKFESEFPALWIGPQRSTGTDQTPGYTSEHYEHHKTEFMLTANVQHIEGLDDLAERGDALITAGYNSVKGWQSDNAQYPFACASQRDASAGESFLSIQAVVYTITVWNGD